MKLNDQIANPIVSGNLKIYAADDENRVFFEDHNVICSTTSLLFARLSSDPDVNAGVWGLVLGNGAASIGNDSATTFRLVNEIKRIKLMSSFPVDSNGVQQTSVITNRIKFLTKVNATTQGISSYINELGLFGGGKSSTDMTTAPFLDPNNQGSNPQNSVILINYKTLPKFTIPADIDLIFAWTLQF